MDPAPQTYVDLVKVILDFIGQHLWSLIALVFLIICRKSIANLVERITKLNFSWGSASGGVEAAAPIPTPEASQRSETVSTASQPSSSAPELPELKEKEEAQEWFSEMHKAFIDGKIEKAKQVFEANQREEHDANRRHSNEAVFLFFLYTKGNDATALSRLEALHARSANDKQRNDSIFWLLWSYEVSKNHDKAERLLQSTISMVTDEAEKTSHIIDLANVYKSKGEPDRGIECLECQLQEVTNPEQRVSLYQALSNLEKEQGNEEIAAIALEKAIELSPGDRDKLFDAAYAQSKVNLRLLSVSNYGTLLNLSPRHAAALNNMGVCASEFKLTGKPVSMYRRSMEEGYTLAMANIANLFMSSGFWEEAKQILDKARVAESPHENVGNALYRLQSLQDDEDKRWTTLTKKADEFQRRVREYGGACFDRSFSSFNCGGVWYTKRGAEVIIELSGQEVKGKWVEQLTMGLRDSSIEYKVSISGIRRNRSVALTYRRRPESERPPTLLGGSLDKSVKCYSYFSLDKQLWEIFSSELDEELTLTLQRNPPK